MIHWSELRVEFGPNKEPISGEVVFSHVDKTSEVRHFAVERIQKDIEHGLLVLPIIETQIDLLFASFSITHRGVEPHRLRRLMATPTEISHYPVVFAHIPGVGRDVREGEYLMIDGAHRYCASSLLGWPTIRGYVMSPAQWGPYLIYIPEIADKTRMQMAAQAAGVHIHSHLDEHGQSLRQPFPRGHVT